MARLFGNSHHRMAGLALGTYSPAARIKTGLHALDKALFGGIPMNKLAIFAARTSHGKTATAVRLAVNMVMAGRSVVIIWCEDEELEFDLRALSLLSGTPFLVVRQAYEERTLGEIWARVPEVKRKRWEAFCSTVQMERPTPVQIAKEIGAWDPGTIFILDLLGEVNWGPGMKHELIGDGLRLIRRAALQSRSLFIGMTQLNRDWDRRKAASENPDDVRPCLSDIENSGQIEQVARVCVICEKVMSHENEAPTGEYRYHVFKPNLAVASMRWHEEFATPDNPEPVRLDPLPPAPPSRAWHEVEQLAVEEEP